MNNKAMAIRKLKLHLSGSNPKSITQIIGQIGTSKLSIIKKVAEDIDAKLIYFNMRQESIGETALPTIHNDSKQIISQYNINPKLQEILDNPEKKYIVVCDELDRARHDVFSEWTTILTERQIQGQKVSDNVRFVITTNS